MILIIPRYLPSIHWANYCLMKSTFKHPATFWGMLTPVCIMDFFPMHGNYPKTIPDLLS